MEWTPAQAGDDGQASLEFPAITGIAHRIGGILFSYYGGTPTGRITIAVNDVTQITLGITASGPGPLPINHTFAAGAKVTVTLAAGGSGVSADLNVEHEAIARFRGT